ncbi:MAG: hypothetical protein JNL98_14645 [Bryobacterales bacterium]|nr:hypothetical protein [Bryobacterales bacterium]
MIPAGYMAKHVAALPEVQRPEGVIDVYSVSGCISTNFADYISFRKHNGYFLFDSPRIIRSLASKLRRDLRGARLFYYEIHDEQLANNGEWEALPEEWLWEFDTNVIPPTNAVLEGFDVVTCSQGTAPECSPLSCNGLAPECGANAHGLLDTFERARQLLNQGAFLNSEPGPYRIFAVYSLAWP